MIIEEKKLIKCLTEQFNENNPLVLQEQFNIDMSDVTTVADFVGCLGVALTFLLVNLKHHESLENFELCALLKKTIAFTHNNYIQYAIKLGYYYSDMNQEFNALEKELHKIVWT